MAERIYGFPPVARPNARVLILGSMPSVESLRQSFYYAHPRNAFWPMLAEILGEARPEAIEDKKALLTRHGIALWDTVESCERAGSLDSAIRSARANDFAALYERCPEIRFVFFNGAAAEQLYRRLVVREDGARSFVRLPSTSPAYTLRYADKKEAWERALKEALSE